MSKKDQFQKVVARLSNRNKNNDDGQKLNIKTEAKSKVPDAVDIQKRNEELRRHKIENDISENELELKKGIYFWVKWVVTIYLSFVAIVIISLFTGFGSLSDNVIIALLTTTTINILGLPYMIIKSLFPAKKRDFNEKY